MSVDFDVIRGAPAGRLLSTNGDETGTIQAIGNYSATPTTFYFQTPANQAFRWDEIRVLYTDGGVFDVGKFGNNGTILSGVAFQYLDPTLAEVSKLQGGLRVLTNGGWELLGTTRYVDYGDGDNGLSATVPLIGGAFCPTGYRISVTLQDNFTFLTSMRFMVFGSRVR
jgi:hypothetical protein